MKTPGRRCRRPARTPPEPEAAGLRRPPGELTLSDLSRSEPERHRQRVDRGRRRPARRRGRRLQHARRRPREHPAVDLDEDPHRLRALAGARATASTSRRRRSSSPTSRSTSARSSRSSPGRSSTRSRQILDPLAWLIGPDGFLNVRIPLLSDLAGHTITGADIVEFFDPTDGPKVKAFLRSSRRSTTWSTSSNRRRAKATSSSTSATSCSRRARRRPATRSRTTARAFRATSGRSSTARSNVGVRRQPGISACPNLKNVDVPDDLGRRRRWKARRRSATQEIQAALIGPTKTFDFPILDKPSRPHQPALRQAGDAGRDQRPDARVSTSLHAGVPDHRAARRHVRGRTSAPRST